MGTAVSIQRDYGERGKASVEDQGQYYLVTFANGKQFNFPKGEGVADWTQPLTGPELYVELRSDNQQIKYMRPWGGQHPVRFLWFTTTEDGPKQKDGYWATRKDGKGRFYVDPRQTMTAVLEIVSGQHKGAQMIRSLDHIFEPDADGTMKIAGKKYQVDRMIEFLRAAGYNPDTDTLPYSQNMLPAFENLLVERDKIFMVGVEEGWPNTFWDYPEGVPLPNDIKPRPQKESTAVPGGSSGHNSGQIENQQQGQVQQQTPQQSQQQINAKEANETLYGENEPSGQPTL